MDTRDQLPVLFEQALNLDSARRREWLVELGRKSPDAALEVELLLVADTHSDAIFSSSAWSALRSLGRPRSMVVPYIRYVIPAR
jgi:hypothetical protein